MKPILAALAVATATVLSAPAQGMDDATLAATVAQRLTGDRTGACFAVAVVEKTVARAYACANPADATRIGADTGFEIGSVSKTMTSTLLARLIADGKGSLDDPLADWLPEGTNVPSFNGQPILLRHVVSHTAGLPALPPGVAIPGPSDPYAAMTPEQLLAALGNVTLTETPGTTFAYSNYASMLLSYAVARRAGKDFDTLLRDELFAPLGMDGAWLGTPPQGFRDAAGHGPNGQPVSAWHFAPDLAGVGGVRATLDAMVRYAQAQLGDAPAPLKAAITLTQQPVDGGATRRTGMNWMLAPLNGRTILAHEGGTGGFSSFVAVDRDRGRAVIVLSDTSMTALGGLGSLGLHLVDDGVPLGKPRKAITAPAALVDGLVGDYTLQNGMTMTLSRQADALVAQVPGQPAFVLGHDDAGDFYPLQFDARLVPKKQPDGRWAFTFFQGGGAVAAVRKDANAADAAPAPSLPAEKLAEYAGVFRFGPPFAITVSVKDGRLFAQGTGQGALEIQYAGVQDTFEAAAVGATMIFERDGDGRVVALVLRQGGRDQRAPKE